MDARSRWGGSPGSSDDGATLQSAPPLAPTPTIGARRLPRLRLPLIDRGLRIHAIIGGGLLLVVLFMVPARIHLGQPIVLDRAAIDDAIPFLEWTIWVYASYYPFLILAVWLPRDARLRSDAVYGLVLAGAIGLVIFTLWPTTIIRESPSLVGVTGLLWHLLFSVDTMVNALPSMHVADTCIAAVALASRGRLWRIIVPVWATIIILSTLTTKQHYAIDLPGGLALAAVCYVLVRFGVAYWRIDRKVGG
jgi:membrane-associated phospholipid phosphatase